MWPFRLFASRIYFILFLQEIEKFRQKLKSVQTDHNKLQASHEDKVTVRLGKFYFSVVDSYKMKTKLSLMWFNLTH